MLSKLTKVIQPVESRDGKSNHLGPPSSQIHEERVPPLCIKRKRRLVNVELNYNNNNDFFLFLFSIPCLHFYVIKKVWPLECQTQQFITKGNCPKFLFSFPLLEGWREPKENILGERNQFSIRGFSSPCLLLPLYYGLNYIAPKKMF